MQVIDRRGIQYRSGIFRPPRCSVFENLVLHRKLVDAKLGGGLCTKRQINMSFEKSKDIFRCFEHNLYEDFPIGQILRAKHCFTKHLGGLKIPLAG
jgi:hypothetical protein